MRVLGQYRWWSILGGVVALLGNASIAALWIWAVLSTPPDTHARYIIEAGLSFAIAGSALVLALPFVVAGFMHRGTRVLAVATLVLSLTPVRWALF